MVRNHSMLESIYILIKSYIVQVAQNKFLRLEGKLGTQVQTSCY